MASSSGDGDLFEARSHLHRILGYVRAWEGVRSLHLFDLFAGIGMASRMFMERGHRCRSFDIKTNPMEDVTTEKGFFGRPRLQGSSRHQPQPIFVTPSCIQDWDNFRWPDILHWYGCQCASSMSYTQLLLFQSQGICRLGFA